MDNTKEHGINLLSLCAGYGGIELGLELAGIRIAKCVYVERDAFAAAVLAKNIEAGALAPGIIHTNVETFPFEQFEGCFTGVVGGYPCQPFSVCGKRGGETDEKGRHLWPAIQRAIRLVQPRFCFFENVQGHVTLGLKDVLHDLDELGFGTVAGLYSAHECGAPQIRKRIFILARHTEKMANPEGAGLEGGRSSGDKERRQTPFGFAGCGGEVWVARPGQPQHPWEEPRLCPELGNAKGGQNSGGESRSMGEAAQGGKGESTAIANASGEPNMANTDRTTSRGTESRNHGEVFKGAEEKGEKYSAPLSGRQGGERNKESGQIESQLGQSTDGVANSGVDAIANRIDRLRMLGNGVVPATAAKAWINLNDKYDAHE